MVAYWRGDFCSSFHISFSVFGLDLLVLESLLLLFEFFFVDTLRRVR